MAFCRCRDSKCILRSTSLPCRVVSSSAFALSIFTIFNSSLRVVSFYLRDFSHQAGGLLSVVVLTCILKLTFSCSIVLGTLASSSCSAFAFSSCAFAISLCCLAGMKSLRSKCYKLYCHSCILNK